MAELIGVVASGMRVPEPKRPAFDPAARYDEPHMGGYGAVGRKPG
jgi:hypothetical protein